MRHVKRHLRCLLLSLLLLPCSIGAVAAQNVCVQAADGAVVCGPVAQRNNNAAPNPFDQPAQNIAPPADALPPAAEPKPLRGPAVRDTSRDVRPPPTKNVYRQPPPRELDRRPPPARRLAREDVRRRELERDRPPPRRVERERPVRYSEAERRREINHERPLPRVDRNVVASRYDTRLRELEREVHALRAEREMAMRRTTERRPPPRELRRDERERYAVSQRAPRRAARERYSNEN